MTVKTLEFKPKNCQDLEDAGQPQSTQTVLALPVIGPARFKVHRATESRQTLGRRRTLARMIRVELEVTLGLLNQALEQANSSKNSDT